MKTLVVNLLILAAPLLGTLSSVAQAPQTMVVAVTRNSSVLTGGLGPGRNSKPGHADAEIVAYVTAEGKWLSHPCDKSYSNACLRFARAYLSKSHSYTVVSADGQGTEISAAPTELSECHDYATDATFESGRIVSSAVAADRPVLFAAPPPLAVLTAAERTALGRQLLRALGRKAQSLAKARIFAVELDGHKFHVLERTYRDCYGDRQDPTGIPCGPYFFSIVEDQADGFRLIDRKHFDDENETVLGTVHLASGHDFLITAVSDPESQRFRVYGIRNGKLALVYFGGGSSC